jgi:hypothetical protein
MAPLNAYTPDLMTFSHPGLGLPRQRVTANEWLTTRSITLHGSTVVGPSSSEAYPDVAVLLPRRLSPALDGTPYYHTRVIAAAGGKMYNLFNGQDPATSGPLVLTQAGKPDVGFVYVPTITDAQPPRRNRPNDLVTHVDRWLISSSAAANNPAFNDFPEILWQGRTYRELTAWNPIAQDAQGATTRAAVLAFFAKSWTQAVGTTSQVLSVDGTTLVPSYDANDRLGLAGGELDHSAQFNYSIQHRSDAIWGLVLTNINANANTQP